jgi:hypothetical protein
MKLTRKHLCLIGFLFIYCIINNTYTPYAQTEQEAATSIQDAQEKLIEVISLLEDGIKEDTDIVSFVSKADSARNLIKEAKDNYLEGNYDTALEKANSANNQLEELIEEIKELLGLSKQRTRIIYSLVGTLSAVLAVGFIFLFFRKIYPWYKVKKLEEYDKLVIIYQESSEEVKK